MRYIYIFFFLFAAAKSFGQSTDLPLNSPAYQVYDRWDLLSEKSYFTTVKPVSRKEMAIAGKNTNADLTRAEEYDLNYIQQESREYLDSAELNFTARSNRFFKYPSDFISVSDPDFDFHMNPVVVFGAGKESSNTDLLFQNYRGFELRGTIDNKISFYTLLTENQARYPTYIQNVTDSTLGVPYEGFWKQYDVTGVDFLRAQAYIDFNISKHINAQFGYGKNFIGNGKRSLILSDFGNNYPYLRLKTQIWKFQYTNIFAQLTAQTAGGSFGLLGTGSFPKKFLALHHLEFKVTDRLNIGLFESVIYGRPDSLGTNSLKLEYMNPVIFYRALEQQDGSADNALLGLDFKWNIFNKISLYGQLVIDELIVSKAFSGDGYWENKQGFQLGGKYIDAFGINNLLIQLEWNQVRPYTYSHQNNFTSYSHYNLPLAHPLGANFREIIASGNYRISPKLTLSADFLIAQYGNDLGESSYGRDILKSYTLKTGSVGIDLLQGDKTSLYLTRTLLSYQLRHNLFTEIEFTSRNESSKSGNYDSNNKIISFALRYNFPHRPYLF